MRRTLIFLHLDGEAGRILEAFGERTGLAGTGSDQRTIFQLDGASRSIDALAELDAIDPAWAEHVRLENPQT
jgi:hypothetical protein